MLNHNGTSTFLTIVRVADRLLATTYVPVEETNRPRNGCSAV
jgi:hypothetical protein